MEHPGYTFFVTLWALWAAYWWLMARDVKAVARRESAASRLAHILPLTIAGVLLVDAHLPLPGLNVVLIPQSTASFVIGAALTVGGLLFAVWARNVIGRNWSASVTLKEDHALVTSGPYAWVRH